MPVLLRQLVLIVLSVPAVVVLSVPALVVLSIPALVVLSILALIVLSVPAQYCYSIFIAGSGNRAARSYSFTFVVISFQVVF